MENKKIIGIVVLVLAALAGAWYFLKGKKSEAEKQVDKIPTGIPGDDALYTEMKEKFKAVYNDAESNLSWMLPDISAYMKGEKQLPADLLVNGQPTKVAAFYHTFNTGVRAWTTGSPEVLAGTKPEYYSLKDGNKYQDVSDFMYWAHRNFKNSAQYAGL